MLVNELDARPVSYTHLTVTAEDEWLHSFFYFNDEIPSDEDFEKTIGDYLTFEFSMIMQNREYLFDQGGESDEKS